MIKLCASISILSSKAIQIMISIFAIYLWEKAFCRSECDQFLFVQTNEKITFLHIFFVFRTPFGWFNHAISLAFQQSKVINVLLRCYDSCILHPFTRFLPRDTLSNVRKQHSGSDFLVHKIHMYLIRRMFADSSR